MDKTILLNQNHQNQKKQWRTNFKPIYMFFPETSGETSSGLTGETRASVMPEKRIPKKKKRKNP